MNFNSRIHKMKNFESSNELGLWDVEKDLLLFDKSILTAGAPTWFETFTYKCAVDAGESLKDFGTFSKKLEDVLSQWTPSVSRQQNIIAVGGGSVGDFAGFVASLLKRGVGLVHVPSTWLAAMDSSIGGKTALNYRGVKNQLGTFYPAQDIVMSEELLLNQPSHLAHEALGELTKMAFISNKPFWEEVPSHSSDSQQLCWTFLSRCVEGKLHYVLQDPYETKSIRQVLNFGHTLGHVLEAKTKQPHGLCVLQGLSFALCWGQHLGLTPDTLVHQYHDFLEKKEQPLWVKQRAVMSLDEASSFVQGDKKKTKSSHLNFIFLEDLGQPLVKEVSLDEFMNELQRQQWVVS